MRRHGFSMTDLLALMCAAALAVILLAPALKRNRDASLFHVSQARLAANAQAHLDYSAANADTFVQRYQTGIPGRNWATILSLSGTSWDFRVAGPWNGEFLGGYQWWAMYVYSALRSQRSPVQISPCDALVLARHKQLADPRFLGTSWSVDSSYWASPTIWFRNTRYDPALTTRADPAGMDVQTRKTAEVSYPSEKALLFERWSFFDGSGSRVASPQVFARSSGWTNIAMCDGSVRLQSMSAVQTLADSASSSIYRVFRPSGRWVSSASTLQIFDFASDGLETPTSAPWAFFWATRNGLAGRDIDRTGLARQAEGERLMRFNAAGVSRVMQTDSH